MNEQPDAGQGTGSGANSGGELRRDRRRLRQSPPDETSPANEASPADAAGVVTPDADTASAFEALGFEPRSFEPHVDDDPPVDTSRFRSPAAEVPQLDSTGDDYRLMPAQFTPQPQASPPPVQPPPAQQPQASPPPLAEPPRPEVPRVTHTFTAPVERTGASAPGVVAPTAGLPFPTSFPVEPIAAQTESASLASGGHPVLGPLTPRPVEEPRELVVLDRAALVLAFLVPPIGFALGLVASARGRALRGWSSGLARAAVWISVAMTVVFAVVGTVLWFEHQSQLEAQREADAVAAARAAVVEESAAFCAAVAATPALFYSGDPDYGWPLAEDPAGYLPAIGAYAALWQGLVPLAPPGIAEQVQSFSSRVDGIVAVANSLPNTNRPGDVLDLHSQPDIEAINAHVGEYCSSSPAE